MVRFVSIHQAEDSEGVDSHDNTENDENQELGSMYTHSFEDAQYHIR